MPLQKWPRGELLQLQKSGDTSITEGDYIEIITAKTGVLISAACRIGAILGQCPAEAEEAFADFGLKAGMAFQMADDILDYMADEADLGKKLGKDLEEGKITLPLICLLRSVSDAEKDRVEEMLGHDLSADGLEGILKLFREHNVLEESFKQAKGFVEAAKTSLCIFPPSPERDEMFELADYALERDK